MLHLFLQNGQSRIAGLNDSVSSGER
jgi:hypothetical protein